jgi:hypothetical protein
MTTGQFPPGASAVWKMDEGSGTTIGDSSGHGNAGTLNNGTGFVPGLSGSALHFDGIDDAVRVARSNSLEQPKVSLAAWVKLDSGSEASWATLIKKTYANDSGPVWGSYSLQLSPDGAAANAVTFFTGTSSGGDSLTSSALLPVNQWVHVAGTYDPAAGQKRLYINGQLVASRVVSAPLVYDTSSGGDLYLGRDPGPGEAFKGAMDNAGVWGRALSSAEVTALVNGSGNDGRFTKHPILNSFGGPGQGRSLFSARPIGSRGGSAAAQRNVDDLLRASAARPRPDDPAAPGA